MVKMSSSPLNAHDRIYRVGGWVGIRAGLHVLEKKKHCFAGFETRTFQSVAIPVPNWNTRIHILVTGRNFVLTS